MLQTEERVEEGIKEREDVVAIVPAYNAQATIGAVVGGLAECWGKAAANEAIIVVDDGSTDETSVVASERGAQVVRHGRNRGKGAALRTGLLVAQARGFRVAVTLDADGQHAAEQAWMLARAPVGKDALVLGVRDLANARAPRANQVSNGISNFFLSKFAGMELQDTQCGLRRYPIQTTLGLGASSNGFAYEAEVLLLARFAGVPIEQVAIDVCYDAARTSHFDVVRDPARIITRVLWTIARGRVTRVTR